MTDAEKTKNLHDAIKVMIGIVIWITFVAIVSYRKRDKEPK